jgi:hypothetical protein
MTTMLNKIRSFIKIFILLTLTASCTKIEMWPVYHRDTTAPGPFTLTISHVTDTTALLSWTTSTDSDNDSVKYEITINDSVIALNLERTYYELKYLVPEKNYSVIVSAVDKWGNQYKVNDEFRTGKKYICEIIDLKWKFAIVIFKKAVKTSDNEVLVEGIYIESNFIGDIRSFVLKMDQNGSLKWFHGFSTELELNDLIECRDAGCLVIFKNSVFRLGNGGEEIWHYTNSDTGDQSELKCATEDENGNFILAGVSDRTWGTDISLQYTLLSLSSSGSELWYHYGGTSLFSRPKDIVKLDNGTILVFGSADYIGTQFDNLLAAKECFWTMQADQDGNFLKQTFYPNAFSDKDMPFSVFVDKENNCLLTGTSHGMMPPNFNVDGLQSRFLKISSEGAVIWDKYPFLTAEFPSWFLLSDNYQVDETHIFVLNEKFVSSLNSSGEIEKNEFLDIDKNPFTVLTDSRGYFHCIMDGSIIIINPEGSHPGFSH